MSLFTPEIVAIMKGTWKNVSHMKRIWKTVYNKRCFALSLLGLLVIISTTMQLRSTLTKHHFTDHPGYTRVLRSSILQNGHTRPVIHTFFHSLSQNEDAVLELWKDEWSNAGFDPVVLDLEHARANPYFKEVQSILTPIHGSTGYNSLCFYRWLAMAMVEGGGWMTDHDTFPTNIQPLDAAFLPRMGAFIAFEGHIPSFMAGSAEEWDRVSHLLMAKIPDIPADMGISDMHALMLLREEGRGKNGIWFDPPHRNTVIQGFRYESPGKVNCKSMKIGKVNHMSHRVVHYAVEKGIYPMKYNEEDPYGSRFRGEAVKMFLDQWRDQCFPKKTVVATPKKSSLLSEYITDFKSDHGSKKSA